MAAPKKRTLEDFFNSRQERSEYVTAPAEDTEFVDDRPVMKPGKEENTATFKRKSGTLKKDLKTGTEVAEMAPIGVDAEIEEAQAPRPKIAELLPPVSGEPPPAARAPATPAPQQVQIQRPEGPSVWERLLIGATPALVGLLTGNELEGTTLSGQTLANTEADLYKRERDLDGKIAEMQAKRAFAGTTAKNPNFARQEIYNPADGKTYIHSIVNGQDMGSLGETAPNKVRDSFQKAVIRNPETGRMEVATINPRTKEVTFHGEAETKAAPTQLADLDFQGESTKALIDRNTGEVIRYVGKNPEKKSPYADLESGRNQRFQDQKLLDLTKEFSKPTSNFNKQKENLDGIVMAAKQLNLGNPRANAGLQNYLARNVYGEKGPLSDSDIARLSGDPSYAAVLERFLDARLSGKLGELDRSDIRQILELAYKTQVQKMQSEATRFGNAFKSIGYDPTPGIQSYVQGSIEELPSHKVFDRGHRSHGDKPKTVIQNGFTYTLNEKTGKYE